VVIDVILNSCVECGVSGRTGRVQCYLKRLGRLLSWFLQIVSEIIEVCRALELSDTEADAEV
jgi:hypothetical protein